MSRAERIQQNKAQQARMEAVRQQTRAIVAANCCPDCGSKIRRNWAITGWVQCEQFGADGFRKDSNKPACDWQGFTE